jgi:hypothetical protein
MSKSRGTRKLLSRVLEVSPSVNRWRLPSPAPRLLLPVPAPPDNDSHACLPHARLLPPRPPPAAPSRLASHLRPHVPPSPLARTDHGDPGTDSATGCAAGHCPGQQPHRRQREGPGPRSEWDCRAVTSMGRPRDRPRRWRGRGESHNLVPSVEERAAGLMLPLVIRRSHSSYRSSSSSRRSCSCSSSSSSSLSFCGVRGEASRCVMTADRRTLLGRMSSRAREVSRGLSSAGWRAPRRVSGSGTFDRKVRRVSRTYRVHR